MATACPTTPRRNVLWGDGPVKAARRAAAAAAEAAQLAGLDGATAREKASEAARRAWHVALCEANGQAAPKAEWVTGSCPKCRGPLSQCSRHLGGHGDVLVEFCWLSAADRPTCDYSRRVSQ